MTTNNEAAPTEAALNEPTNAEVTHPEAAYAEANYAVAIHRATTHYEKTCRAVTHAEASPTRRLSLLSNSSLNPSPSKASWSKAAQSKSQLSNFCCRWDIPNISIINILYGIETLLENMIMQNKPNLGEEQITLKALLTTTNDQRLPTFQAQNKPNTNPIQTQFKANTKPFKPNTKPFKPILGLH